MPTASNGILDAARFDFLTRAHLPLNGQWEFYMSALYSPEDFGKRKQEGQEWLDFPSSWNDLNKSHDPGFGYATYRLRVILNPDVELAMEIPDMYSAYVLWINGVIISKNGTVGTTQNESVPQYLPTTVPIPNGKDTLDIVLQISNFHHAKGGIREPIVIGHREEMLLKRSIAVNANIVMFVVLVFIALTFLLIFAFSKRQWSLVFFCALCITWGVRSMFSNLYVAISFMPDFSWELAAKIEYISLFLVMIWAVMLIGSLFRNDSNNLFKYLFTFCNGLFIVLTLVFKAATYTQFLPVYLSFCAVLLLYILYVIVRALVLERAGALSMILCTFLGVIVFAYDLIAYQGMATYNPIITGTGYVLMFLLMAAALMYDLGYLKRSSRSANVLTYDDLYGSGKK